jgi:hypothetical protein
MAERAEPSDKRRIPFAKVDVPVIRDPTLTPQCKVLYALLISYGPGLIYPSHETLAKHLGVKPRAVVHGLQELRERRLIDWVRTGRSNHYRIIGPRCASQDTSDMHPETDQMCPPEQIRCAPGDTRSRSTHLDPSTQRDTAETAAPTSPSSPSSQNETEGTDARPSPGRLKQAAKGNTPLAVGVFRQATGHYPPKSWQSDIAQTVGDDEADLSFWHDVCKAWVGQGWKPRNVRGMLEYYQRREIPGGRGPPTGNGRRRPGANRRRGRGEYPSYTTSQRDVLWAQHKDRYLELVGQGLNPNLHGDDIAKRLDVTREEGHILHAAYCTWLSMQERPLDLSFLDEDT